MFGGLIAVIVGIVLLIWQPWSSGDAPAPKPPASSTAASPSAPTDSGTEASAAATTEATAEAGAEAAANAETATPGPTEPAEVVACGPRDVTVAAHTDKDSYGADELPQLTLSLTNETDVDCTIDIGTAAQEYTITSGSDTWWRSTDCQANPTSQIVTLAAGQTASSQQPLVWDRTRSSVTTCADDTRPRAAGGGASYHLLVSIGGIESIGSAQFLLY